VTGSGGAAPGEAAGRRFYELRLSPIADPRVREAVAQAIARRVPAQAPPLVTRALEGAGFLGRLELRDDETPTVLRELYAAGAPPAAVFLLPADRSSRRGAAEAPPDDAFALFAERGGRFVPTWNWWAFLLGPVWYLRQGLYVKGGVILVLVVYPFWPLPIAVAVSLTLFLYCGVAGNWDQYLLKVKRSQFW
jgi:hypothetical protein